jgi:hypothetical protein
MRPNPFNSPKTTFCPPFVKITAQDLKFGLKTPLWEQVEQKIFYTLLTTARFYGKYTY